ncbi:MAG TPA: 3-deoxy-7-phosphoheptulonate synthase [Ktedonobacteraceae bacterium]|jgi:3-deoxy-7-phosphoheptulonate synthase|nr:3-deoxy-7-phosphoheptulonate synthase [Ktedonobacteraceae bacterium]
MIITIHNQATSEERAHLMALLCRITGSQHPITTTTMSGCEVIALDGKQIDSTASTALEQQSAIARLIPLKTPYQLVSRAFQTESTSILIGETHGATPVTIGGDADPVIMAGPCAVENHEQLLSTARAVKKAGATVLRGGAFKPRTSPYQFQGLGIEGLHLLAEAREETGLPIITEVMEPAMVEEVAQHADILQIGARNMQNYALLRTAGQHSKKLPVLLKRGLSATIDEWLLAAEYIVAAGNPNVILCERGIRSYDSHTRNVLDLTCIPLLRNLTHLPVIVDPSHATGLRELVPIMSRAGIAAEADGLIIETHLDPDNALCDGRQSITPEQLEKIVYETKALASIVKRELQALNV